MSVLLVTAATIGAFTGALMILIYRRAFQTPGVKRLVWVFPVGLLFLGSLSVCLASADRLREGNRTAAAIAWLAGLSLSGPRIRAAYLTQRR